ncbi:MAG: hypothetical protein K9W42_00025 [Candidatus Heimdallarchaeota archaeon]|nr:hypothetical protein [Candidatus Heimdallarchaeota archaeon]
MIVLNDKQLMKQIRKYYDRLPKNNIESIPPRVFYQTFMGICKNVELLDLVADCQQRIQ